MQRELMQSTGEVMQGTRANRREGGLALVTAVLILIVVAMIAIAGLQSSEEEMRAGGRSRSTMSSFYAAEAGVEYAENRVRPPRDLTGFAFTLADGSTVQSRKRDQTGSQPIVEAGLGTPPSGYSINIGSGFQNELFELNVTASKPNTPTSELEVKVGVLTSNSGAY